MSNALHTSEFKAEAIKQGTELRHGVVVFERLGGSDNSLYRCIAPHAQKMLLRYTEVTTSIFAG